MIEQNRLPILYSFRRCPYAMRARMALLVGGIACQVREVVLRDKPAELRAASAKATVPVLVLPDGRVIDESLDIMRWALARADPEGWLAGNDAALIAGNDGAFKHHLDRYKYPERHGSNAAVHRAGGSAWLERLEARLQGHAHLCGDDRSIADIALFPFVRQFAAVDQDWYARQPLPALHGWLDRHAASPLFAQAMIRRAPWRPGDRAVLLDAPAA